LEEYCVERVAVCDQLAEIQVAVCQSLMTQRHLPAMTVSLRRYDRVSIDVDADRQRPMATVPLIYETTTVE